MIVLFFVCIFVCLFSECWLQALALLFVQFFVYLSLLFVCVFVVLMMMNIGCRPLSSCFLFFFVCLFGEYWLQALALLLAQQFATTPAHRLTGEQHIFTPKI